MRLGNTTYLRVAEAALVASELSCASNIAYPRTSSGVFALSKPIKEHVLMRPGVYRSLVTREFDLTDVQQAAKRIIESQRKVKRFEHCPYVAKTPSLYDHNRDTADRALEFLRKADININGKFANDLLLEILIHDQGEAWGEGDSLTIRNQLYYSDYKEFKYKVESMIAYLTWALVLYEQKHGFFNGESLYDKAEREASVIINESKQQGKDAFVAAAQYFIQFVAEHADQLAEVFASNAGKIAAKIVSKMEEFENYDSEETPDYVVAAKLFEKLDTLAYAAENADFSKMNEQQRDRSLGYVNSAKEAFDKRVRQATDVNELMKLKPLLDAETARVLTLIKHGTAPYIKTPGGESEYKRGAMGATEDDSIIVGDDLIISEITPDLIFVDDENALDSNVDGLPVNSIVGNAMTIAQGKKQFKQDRITEAAPLIAKLDRIKADWDNKSAAVEEK